MKNIFYIGLFFLFLCAGTITVQAQKGYLRGYLIFKQGDSLKGNIRDRKFVNGTMGWQQIDVIDENGKKYKFDPEEVMEYRRLGKPKNKTLTIGVESKKTFVEVQEEGAVILYGYNRGTWGGAGNAIKVKTSEAGPKEHVEFFLEKEGKPNSLMQWRPRDYKNTAKEFFGTDTLLMRKIDNNLLKEDDVREIVRTYNKGR